MIVDKQVMLELELGQKSISKRKDYSSVADYILWWGLPCRRRT